MTVGGLNKILAVQTTLELRQYLEAYLSVLWPDALYDRHRDEWRVYENLAAQDDWDRFGMTSENDDSMIYSIFSKDRLTLVVSLKENAQTCRMADEFFTNVQVNFHRFLLP